MVQRLVETRSNRTRRVGGSEDYRWIKGTDVGDRNGDVWVWGRLNNKYTKVYLESRPGRGSKVRPGSRGLRFSRECLDRRSNPGCVSQRSKRVPWVPNTSKGTEVLGSFMSVRVKGSIGVIGIRRVHGVTVRSESKSGQRSPESYVWTRMSGSLFRTRSFRVTIRHRVSDSEVLIGTVRKSLLPLFFRWFVFHSLEQWWSVTLYGPFWSSTFKFCFDNCFFYTFIFWMTCELIVLSNL